MDLFVWSTEFLNISELVADNIVNILAKLALEQVTTHQDGRIFSFFNLVARCG
jgi:hypothetical protein